MKNRGWQARGKRGSTGGIRACLGLIVLVIAAAVIFAGPPLVSGLQQHLGLDLEGGVSVLFQAVSTPGAPVTPQAMNSLRDNFERRINGLGVASPSINLESGNRILVDLAGVKDPDQAVAALGKTAQLQFKTPDGKVVLTGADLKSATAE